MDTVLACLAIKLVYTYEAQLKHSKPYLTTCVKASCCTILPIRRICVITLPLILEFISLQPLICHGVLADLAHLVWIVASNVGGVCRVVETSDAFSRVLPSLEVP